MTAADASAAVPQGARWTIILAVVLTAVLEVLDSTIVNVALPHMKAAFGITNDQTVWILTSYIVASVVVMPLTGFFVRRIGRRRLITTAILGFAGFSALCGLSWSVEIIVACRIGQGIFGAFLIPLSQSILFDSFPKDKRGQAMALFGLGVVVAPVLDPYKPIEAAGPPISVQVVGLDWKWLFIYPDEGIASVNELAFPAGSSVALDITTDTVMQSFMIPALAGQIYAMPGMRTKLHVLADNPGTFLGENTQWSGVGFAEQKFEARAMTPEAFAEWVAEVKAKGVLLNTSTYGRLAESSTGTEAHDALGTSQMPGGVIWFNEVEPRLFETVMHRYMQGTPVPPALQPGAVGYEPPTPATGESQ